MIVNEKSKSLFNPVSIHIRMSQHRIDDDTSAQDKLRVSSRANTIPCRLVVPALNSEWQQFCHRLGTKRHSRVIEPL